MRHLKVYDDLVPFELVEQIHDLLDRTGFTRTEYDHAKQDKAKVMPVAELSIEDPLVQQLCYHVCKAVPDFDKLYCYRVYANCYTPSDCPEPHVDLHVNDGYTVLYYANKEWSWEHGGETVFFECSPDHISRAVLPKPGRVAVFDPTIYHCARVQNSLAPKYRYTIAIKLRYQ